MSVPEEMSHVTKAIITGLVGLVTGIAGSFIGFSWWPWLRRRTIENNLSIKSEPFTGKGGIWCRIMNGSGFTMGRAIAYISIEHTREDMIDPPPGRDAFNRPCDNVILHEGQMCWAVQEGGTNPMRLDIYAGESQPISFGEVDPSWIEIVSERCHSPSRVFLRRRNYKGVLKIVSADCRAVSFSFEIQPDNRAQPICFKA